MNASRTTPRVYARARRRVSTIGAAGAWALRAALGLVVAADLVFFAIHAAHLLGYHYPLDYGEGPLLAQVRLLLAGTPVWRLYADPVAPPYAIVNYPPVYHLLTALVALPLGDALLAGRLVSLAAALGAVAALWQLSADPAERPAGGRPLGGPLDSWLALRGLVVLAFLALPIVRQWSVLMRVDMPGVSLGLWGLLLVRRHAGRSRVLWAALPLALSLYVKPSLIAAPAAALVWLLFRDHRRALALGALMAALGGLAFALLQIASGGWFATHVFAANANAWEASLAYGFWHDQMVILWPLLAAGVAGFLARRLSPVAARLDARSLALLPLYYALFGAITAFGVGKVGAYANYFLEFYAGLIWLAASAIRRPTNDERRTIGDTEKGRHGDTETSGPGADARRAATGDRRSAATDHRWSVVGGRWSVVTAAIVTLMLGAMLRYYPLWSATYLELAGIIEKENPPRLVFGRYGVWQDLRRERDILQTQSGVNAALVAEVRAARAPIFTDVPGVAAQAGQLARLQAFEHRQLFDAGLASQRPLLGDLANGQVPLVVLDYLGNWLTPEMIALIEHRYAQDGSRGTYDLYRPVDPGPLTAADLAFPGAPRLVGYHLAPSPGRPAYHGDETLLLTLDWRREPRDGGETPRAGYEVVAQLTDGAGSVLLEITRRLLYDALPPSDWPAGATVQHMHPIALPSEVPPGIYELALTLRSAGRDLAPPRAIARIAVEAQAGQLLGGGDGAPRAYFVPAPLLDAWEHAGGDDGPGQPLMPAVPFPGYTMQCFVRACLRLDEAGAYRLPLGELIHLGDAGLAGAPPAGGAEERFAETGQSLRGPFLDYWRAHGAIEAFGPPISAELIRGGMIVQYTRYARLERAIGGGAVGLGRLGDDFLRLPGGVPYRWP